MSEPGLTRVLAAVIRRGDRYLLCQRPRHKRHGGLWEFPGGKLEPGETLAHAAERELREELALETEGADDDVAFSVRDPGSEFVIEFVFVRARGEPQALEHEALRWVTFEEAAQLELAPSDRAFVEYQLAPLGLERGVARLVPWQPAWAALFRQEVERILAVCGDAVLAVEHIGSTAIPGMPAKPVLDLMAAVRTRAAGLTLLPALATLGYEHRPDPEIPERIYLRKLSAGMRTHHLSLAEPESRFYRAQLCFRDTLRGDAAAAAEYAALKERLAAAHPRDREAYTAGKAEFVRRVLARAGCA